LSTNSGSVDNFGDSTLCGASPNARHTRDTVDCDIPRWAAIDRVDQCVPSRGAVSNVSVISASTWASDTVRGRPGRGSSTNPSMPRPANRPRQTFTVERDTANRVAIAEFASPSAAAAYTIRLRSANPAALRRRRTTTPTAPAHHRSARSDADVATAYSTLTN
jgi:hypothetical protein